MTTVNAAQTTTANYAGQNQQKADFLGKDAFLHLLVTQMRYQDPLSPLDDKQFLAQMAQFTALEQTQNLTAQMNRLNALAMIGREVVVAPASGGDPVLGVVELVSVRGSNTYITVNGFSYTLDEVLEVW